MPSHRGKLLRTWPKRHEQQNRNRLLLAHAWQRLSPLYAQALLDEAVALLQQLPQPAELLLQLA
jgi:hypothetical protein